MAQLESCHIGALLEIRLYAKIRDCATNGPANLRCITVKITFMPMIGCGSRRWIRCPHSTL